ncbi:hypothetical protein [Cryobacterium sp. Y57]|nr:hypothetical protein [Cryobacterium sp. Y57]
MQRTCHFENVLKITPPLCLTVTSTSHFLHALDEVLGELTA